MGSIREIFFLNQLRNAGSSVTLPRSGDFLINQKWTFEIGGTAKGESQIKNIPKSYLAIDEIEIGFQNRIPLWLFDFL